MVYEQVVVCQAKIIISKHFRWKFGSKIAEPNGKNKIQAWMSTVVRYLLLPAACARHTARPFFLLPLQILVSTLLITHLFLLSWPKRLKQPRPIPTMYRPQLPILPVWPLIYFITRRQLPPRLFPLPLLIVNAMAAEDLKVRIHLHQRMFLQRKHFCCVNKNSYTSQKSDVCTYLSKWEPFQFSTPFPAFSDILWGQKQKKWFEYVNW